MEYLNESSQIDITLKASYCDYGPSPDILVHELSALHRSVKWFLTCSSYSMWNIWMKLHKYVYHQRLRITTKVRHSHLFSS